MNYIELPSVGGYILPTGIVGPMYADDTPDLDFGAQSDVNDDDVEDDWWSALSDEDRVTVNAIQRKKMNQ